MKMEKIFQQVLSKIKPSEAETNKIIEITEKFTSLLENQIKKQKIKAEAFLGGSLAKETIIKKEKYDIDIFVRFDKKYEDKSISEILEKILKNLKAKTKIKYEKIHGSRDYFNCKFQGVFFEVVPVKKISKPSEAENVTDLSFFHVSYVKREIGKNKKLADEIRLAKAYCYSQECYGAESYISGFSGYALELLIIYYKSLKKFLEAISKTKLEKKSEQLVIDTKKFYKNKQEIMLEINEAKLQSPIIFIDPTYKERNATAGLSYETFFRLQKSASNFLRKPSLSYFETKKEKLDEWKNKAKKQKSEFLLIEAKSSKQKGDIAAAKLKKFYDFFSFQLKRNFEIKESKFEFRENRARYYFILKAREEIIIKGPPITNTENLTKFKKKHKNAFIKAGRAYAKIKSLNLADFYKHFLKKNKKVMKDMSISSLRRV